MIRRIAVLVCCGVLAACAWGTKKKAKAAPASFDYYLLTLSWAPDYCALPGNSSNTVECGTGKKTGFVVHGLWPQDETTRGPLCKPDGQQVPASIVKQMLAYIPTKGLIQHEWDTHGSCSGLTMAAFFTTVRNARDSVVLPAAFKAPTTQTTMTAAQIEAAFAAANPAFPPTAFRATCTSGMLQDTRVCFTKNLKARACSASAGECSGPMKILPVR